MIARYWSLIGNVQPGVMKGSWIHHSERVETAKNLNLIIDPYFTFNQRYSHMIPLDRRLGSSFNRERTEGPVSQDSNSAVVLTPKVLRTTAKQLIAQGSFWLFLGRVCLKKGRSEAFSVEIITLTLRWRIMRNDLEISDVIQITSVIQVSQVFVFTC